MKKTNRSYNICFVFLKKGLLQSVGRWHLTIFPSAVNTDIRGSSLSTT